MINKDTVEYYHFAAYLLECVFCRVYATGFVGKLKYRVRLDELSKTYVIETTTQSWEPACVSQFPVYYMLRNLTYESLLEIIREHICLNR